MPRINRVKQAIGDGRIATGFSLCFPSPHIVEILGRLDFDFVWLDGEHGPFSLESLEDHCRTADAVGITPIARVPNIQTSTILQYLDRGIQGILGPHIASKADAEQLVKANQPEKARAVLERLLGIDPDYLGAKTLRESLKP